MGGKGCGREAANVTKRVALGEMALVVLGHVTGVDADGHDREQGQSDRDEAPLYATFEPPSR